MRVTQPRLANRHKGNYEYRNIIITSIDCLFFDLQQTSLQKKNTLTSIIKKDIFFSKQAVQEALRSIGYAVSPESSDPAEAVQAGYTAVKTGGIHYGIIVSIISLGIAAEYLKNANENISKLISLQIHELIANEFNLKSNALWDANGTFFKNSKNAEILFNKSTQYFMATCNHANENPDFKKLILNVINESKSY